VSTIAPERISSGYAGFLALCERVGFPIEPFQRRIAKAAFGPEPEFLCLIGRGKGIDSLIAGLNARHPGQRWRVSSPPHRLEGAGTVGTGNVDGAGIVAPDHEDSVGNNGTARTAANEDVADHAVEKVA
jgi:hypothetical protein